MSAGADADFRISHDQLSYLPASVLLALYQRRALSPVEVLEAQIARVEAYGERVNAITYEHFDAARESARVAEQRYANGTARALEGITVGVKDEHGEAGWIVTEGSVPKRDNRLADTDPLAQRLLEAGAILSHQTTVPELYLHFCTWTELWGVTRNPWNLSTTVGGSSGGSGASLAAGFCTIATGSDMGGSIRLPASWCGLYGFKPPYGRVPTALPLSLFSGSGPMARTFEDMVRMQNVIGHPHPTSPTTLPHQELPLSYEPVDGLRIAYSPDQGWAELDPEVAAACRAGVDVLVELGATVDELELDLGVTDHDLGVAFAEMAFSGPMGADLAGVEPDADQLTPYARHFVQQAAGAAFGSEEARAYRTKLLSLHGALTDQVWSRGYDVLVSPTVATAHVAADFDFTSETPTVNGKPVGGPMAMVLTVPFNLLNWYPVVNVPAGLSSARVPIGLQIIGNSFRDETVMRVASGYAGAAPTLFAGELVPDFRAG